MADNTQGARQDESADTAPNQERTIRSEELLQGAQRLTILHGEEAYRLILTRNNRLILQK